MRYRLSLRRLNSIPTRLILLSILAAMPWMTGCDVVFNSVIQSFIDPFLGERGRTGFHPPAAKPVPTEFVNWESPHIHPLDLTPDGSRLLAVNTPAAALEVLDPAGSTPTHLRSIRVGLDPVTVRARTNDEAWVVNHASDSISIVDLLLGHVVRTLEPGDEPTDVAFAAGRAFVVCSQINQVKVFDLGNLDAAPITLEIAGEDPRAIEVGPDGKTLYVSIFESGNRTTIVPIWVASDASGPYGGVNPPPDLTSGLRDTTEVTGPKAGVIVKKDAAGVWRDGNGVDWSSLIAWDVHDHDLAVINADTLAIDYRTNLMNLNMAFSVRPDGAVAVVGTDAINEIRFEPVLTGRFVRSRLALVPAAAEAPAVVNDLNPHLADAYAMRLPRVAPEARALSVADPRGVVWSPDGAAAFVTGMGSNNVVKIDELGNRLGQVDVGEGPTGIHFDVSRNRLYVLSKFAYGVSVIDPAALTELARVSLPDPTPAVIRAGRPFLYDAHRTSGLGVTACGSCHIDGRMDQIAWDLGNPNTGAKPLDQECDPIFDFGPGFEVPCGDFHPNKGPMTTQTLQGIIGVEPLHWRGDKKNLAEFNPAFVGLNGADVQLTPEEMSDFEAFVATLTFPANPFRGRDNSLPEVLGNGNPRLGESIFMTERIDGRPTEFPDYLENSGELGADFLIAGQPLTSCNRCHQIPTGSNQVLIPGVLLLEPQSMKVPQLRNMFEKTGFDHASTSNNRGFGFIHDGTFGSVEQFLSIGVFHFGAGDIGVKKRRDVSAFSMAFPTETHPGIGWTVTLTAQNTGSAAVQKALDDMMKLADDGWAGLTATAHPADIELRYRYETPGKFIPVGGGHAVVDPIAATALRGPVTASHEITWMVVPLGMED